MSGLEFGLHVFGNHHVMARDDLIRHALKMLGLLAGVTRVDLDAVYGDDEGDYLREMIDTIYEMWFEIDCSVAIIPLSAFPESWKHHRK